MLNVTTKTHRANLRAGSGAQRLYVMLKLLPSPEAGNSRPRVDLVVVMDTSGSMREPAPGTTPELIPTPPVEVDGKTYNATFRGASKIDIAIEAARRLAESQALLPEDSLALIQFDDRSSVVASGPVGADRARWLEAIERLREFSGGTQMAPGLRNAESELRGGDEGTRTVLLLTDGLAIDEDECRRAAASLAELCNITQGKPYDFRDITKLPQIFEEELGSATRQVVSDVQLTLKAVKDVRLISAARVYPSLAELDVKSATINLGSLEAGDHTVFIFELEAPERPTVRARLAQIGLTYWVSAERYRGEVPPIDVTVEYTSDETLSAVVDPEVMGYVQQRNVDNLVRQATEQAPTNPEGAARTLQLARSMTQRLGNRSMTVALGKAEEELRGSGTISIGTRKTIKLGSRTQTMKVGPTNDAPQNVPSEEGIRRMTGA